MSAGTSQRWLSNLPRTWIALPLRYRYSVQLGKMLDAKQITGKHYAPYLRNIDVQWGRVNVDDLPEMDFDADDKVRFSLRPGDLLVCEGGEIGRAAVWQGHIAECYYQKAIHRVRALSASECPQFLYYCFHAAVSAGVFTGGTGTTTIEHLPAERLRNIRFPFPPAGEQLAVASFLDRKTTEIDALIARKQRLLELLAEQRSALITKAVTKGLKPNAPTKPSGLPWLSDIPAHWDAVSVRSLITFITSGSRGWAKFYSDVGPWFMQSGNIGRNMDLVDLSTVQCVLPPPGAEGVRTVAQVDDILVCITGARTGSVAHISGEVPEAYVNQHMAIVRPNQARAFPRYLAYVLWSAVGREQFWFSSYGMKEGLGLNEVVSVRVPLPPLREQEAIAADLDRIVPKMDGIAAHIQRAVDKVHEYRSALITAAVTGQIDVRRWEPRKAAA